MKEIALKVTDRLQKSTKKEQYYAKPIQEAWDYMPKRRGGSKEKKEEKSERKEKTREEAWTKHENKS